jgi:hypothetical protein
MYINSVKKIPNPMIFPSVFIIYLRDEFEKKVKTMMVNNYTYIKTNNRTSPKKIAAYDVVNPGWDRYKKWRGYNWLMVFLPFTS